MSAPPFSSAVLSFEDARHTVEQHSAHLGRPSTQIVDLLMAAGRVLAEPVSADRDIPPFPRSVRDGYAVRAADLVNLPAELQVIAEIKAGSREDQIPAQLESGQAAAIMTGAPVPPGADAVVMVEFTMRKKGLVEITKAVAAGDNFVPRAAEAEAGSQLLSPGCRLNDSAIALAASVGKVRLQVYKRPQVAVLSTGDEIVELDGQPGPTQIRNSNAYSLAVQIQNAGGEPLLLPIAPDEPRRLRELIEEGLRSDLLLLSGGVSMGEYDLVEQVFSDMRAEFFFTGARIQPGRPVVFGRVGSQHERLSDQRDNPLATPKYFFGLPGNPVSTMVTFELFARQMLEALCGLSPRKLAFLHGRLKSDISVKSGLTRFLPGLISGEFENSQVELIPWKGSGDIAAIAKANCYVVISPDRESMPAGEWVAVLSR